MPILSQFSFGEKIKYIVNIGGFAGYLLGQRAVTERPNQPRIVANDTDRYKRFDVGVAGGFGMVFPLKEKLSLSWEFRHTAGLYNIAKFTGPTNDTRIETTSTNFLVGLTYGLGPVR